MSATGKLGAPPKGVAPLSRGTQFDELVKTLVNGHWELTSYRASILAVNLLDGGVNTPHDLKAKTKSELQDFGFEDIDMIDMATDVGVCVLGTKAGDGGIFTIEARFYKRGVGAYERDGGLPDMVIELPPQAETEVTLEMGSEFEVLDDNTDTICDPDYWSDNVYSVRFQVRCKSEARPSMCIGGVRIQSSVVQFKYEV